MESADVVIAGGGIMGCALAYQLAKRDVDVILLERETLGSQSTGKCAGGVRQQFSMEANVRLQRMSVRMFEKLRVRDRTSGRLSSDRLPLRADPAAARRGLPPKHGDVAARRLDPGAMGRP